ncbi:MAG: hypothetical protein M1457_10315 [bacterium]|nr:hypothetical protein [bacterium]
MAKMAISHSRDEETPQAKARWFQSLTVEQRMDLLCEFTELILSIQPDIAEKKDAPQARGRVCVLKRK